jgi:hypothetical protein
LNLRNNKRSSLRDFTRQFSYINYLLQRGYLFRCKFQNEEVLILPDELKNILDTVDETEMMTIVKTNNVVCKIGEGILYTYGVMKHDPFFMLSHSMFSNYINGSADIKIDYSKLSYSVYFPKNELYEKAKTIFSNYAEYSTKINDSRFNAKYYERYYSYYSVFDPYNIFFKQQSREDVTFLPISCNDILTVHQGDDKAKKAMSDKLISNLGIGKLKADMLVEEWSCYVKNGEPPEIFMELILEQIDFESTFKVNELFMFSNRYFVNAISQWIIKGHDPNELSGIKTNEIMKSDTEDTKKRDKVGRNDPCPCGSGKKYKKCCGK